jgi:uncharacterized protein (DUF305 family)
VLAAADPFVYPVQVLLSPTFRSLALAAAGAALSLSCRSARPATAAAPAAVPIVQPGAPGQAPRAISAVAAADLSKVQFTPADVKFMQGMIGHHAQAVEMVALVPSRTASEDMKKLALRIDVSQQDEIKMMQGWLQSRGQALPDPHAHHLHPEAMMPGMLSPAEMERLAAAKGAEFDRLFLEGMIKHHGGAITMVEELFKEPGAAQDSAIFAFASDVDADQRMEIDRMGGMLVALLKERQR